MADFFISYNKADRSWAEWVAATLEEGKYTTLIQAWDFLPGENWLIKMEKALIETSRTLAVLSNNYLAAIFAMAEWRAAFKSDPTGEKRKLIPVRIDQCKLPPLYESLIYCDLVGLDEAAAERALLEAVSDKPRLKPEKKPLFPGSKTASVFTKNVVSMRSAILFPEEEPSSETKILTDLLNTLETTYTTFIAQARIRNELVEKMKKRLDIKDHLEFEDFFEKYFSQINPDELQLHEIMRNYTIDVFYEYNSKALDIISGNPVLKEKVPRLRDLEKHLTEWKKKYEQTFLPSPSMPLCYVGVREKLPFPSGIEKEIRSFLGSE